MPEETFSITMYFADTIFGKKVKETAEGEVKKKPRPCKIKLVKADLLMLRRII